MRTKSWLLLTAVTLVAVVAAAIVVQRRQAELSGADVASGPLFPKLLARVNDVQSITVATAKKHFTIARQGASATDWVLREKGDYPADADKVKEAVVGVAELKTLEPRTAKPALYDKIGVADIDKSGSEATRLELKDKSGKVLAAVLIGKTKSYASDTQPATLYVRKAGEAQSWLAQGRLDLRPDPVTWLKTAVVKIDQDRIMRVELTPATGPAFSIARDKPAPADFVLSGLPAGAQPKVTNINGITSALDLVRFADVAPIAQVDFKQAATAVYHTFDGLVVTVHTVQHDGKPWSKFQVAVDAAQAAKGVEGKPAPPVETAKAEKAKAETAKAGTQKAEAAKAAPAKAPEDPVAKAKQEAAKLSAALGPWAFQLPDYRSVNFTRTLADMEIKPKAPKQSPAASK